MKNIEKLADDVFSIDAQLQQLTASIRAQADELNAKKKAAQSQLDDAILEAASAEFAEKEYGCGTVNLQEGNYKFKVVVSKKVKWDNSQLERIHAEIKDSGTDPSAYLKVSYKVNEASYKSWGDNIQGYFEPARTVEVSKPAIKIEKVEV